jgi:dTDP-4-amino-4,6-dideoxygalactose transaminase
MLTKKNHIPFNSPLFFKNSLVDINNLKYKKHYSSDGYFSKKCSEWLVKNIKCKQALMVNSCTTALEMSAILMDIKKNDEIIMPSYTFVSTANAFVMRGGKPVFVDIEKTTLTICLKSIERAITKKTKAIVVVHYSGISPDMDKLVNLCKKNKIFLVEDAAQAIYSFYKNRMLGSFGDFACLSFHETKNIHCGQGGALLINNSKFIERAKIIKDKGTNRGQFEKNLVKKYTWVDIGSSYGLSEINCAYLYCQMLKIKKIINKRIKIWNAYFKYFSKIKNIQNPQIPTYNKHNGHIYYVIIKNFFLRDKILKALNKKKVNAVFHYIPLHSSKAGKKYARISGNLSNTVLISKSLIRLPLFYDFKISDVKKFFNIFNKCLIKNSYK